MAAAILAKPGTEAGPCVEPCEHTDCAATRKMAEAECVWCDEPIGYDTRLYEVDKFRYHSLGPLCRVYAHARCEERRIEAARVKAGRS